MNNIPKLLFHQRVPLLLALAIGALPAATYWIPVLTAMLGGLFDIRSWSGMLAATAINTVGVWAAYILCITIKESAPERFDVTPPPQWDQGGWMWMKRLFWLVLLVLMPIFSLKEAWDADGPSWQWALKLGSACAGLLLGYGIIWGTVWLFVRLLVDERDSKVSAVTTLPWSLGQRRIDQARQQSGLSDLGPIQWLEARLATLLTRFLGAGWQRQVEPPDPALAPRLTVGHRFALSYTLVIFVLMWIVGFIASFDTYICTHVFLVFTLLIVFMALSVLTFVFDRWRIPVLLAVGAGLFLLSKVDRLDHRFTTRSLVKSPPPVKPVSPYDLLFGEGSPDVPILVTAEGGGIHSGAWACHVLATLEMMCRETGTDAHQKRLFGKSIVCTSGVSGGSYGLMYWVDSYGKNGALPDTPEELYRLSRGRAMRPSLDHAVRGLVYHDLWHLTPIRFGLADDRGTMLEKAWSRDLTKPDGEEQPWLSNWAADAAARRRPAVLFNATSVQTGRPIVFGTSLLEMPDAKAKSSGWHYLSHWPDMDVPIVSAVRASASFPFVTPAVRPSDAPDETSQHLVDGGYFDNTGVASMIQWLESGLRLNEEITHTTPPLPKKTILFIRILESNGDGSDEKQADAKNATTDQPKKALSVDKGSLFQIQAPVTTLLKTRSTGHRHHGDQALAHLVVKAKNLRGITIIRADFVYPKGEQPLTWHLTRNQMQDMATIKLTGGDEKAMDKPLPDISTEGWKWYGTSTSREVTNVWAGAATIPERKGKADLQREALSKALTPSDFDLKSIASGAKTLSKPPPLKPNAPEALTEAWRAVRDTLFPQEKASANPPSPVIR